MGLPYSYPIHRPTGNLAWESTPMMWRWITVSRLRDKESQIWLVMEYYTVSDRNKKWHITVNPWCALPDKFHSDRCIASPRRTRNCKYVQISGVPRPTPTKLQIRPNFESDVYPEQLITNRGQIWLLRLNSWCPLPRQISAWLVYTVILRCRKPQIWPQILNFVGSCTHSSWPNKRQIWRVMVDL